jgi:hypothetical protein
VIPPIKPRKLVCRVGADYLSELLYTPEAVIQDAERALADVRFGSIVGTGLSGTLAAPLLARHFGVPFAIIRKADEQGRHSSCAIEGTVSAVWIMADDRVATGATCARVRAIVGGLRLPDGAAPQFAGLYVTKGNGRFLRPDAIPRPAIDI